MFVTLSLASLELHSEVALIGTPTVLGSQRRLVIPNLGIPRFNLILEKSITRHRCVTGWAVRRSWKEGLELLLVFPRHDLKGLYHALSHGERNFHLNEGYRRKIYGVGTHMYPHKIFSVRYS
jgi:hypothetical protein